MRFVLFVYAVFCVCGTVLLSLLKLQGHLNYPWWVVTIPAWTPVLGAVLYIVWALIYRLFTWPAEARNRRYS